MEKKTYTVCFFPWLKIKNKVKVGKVSFVPYRSGSPKNLPDLNGLDDSLSKILSSYKDMQGNPISNCVVACVEMQSPIWNYDVTNSDSLRAMTNIMALSCISENEYFDELGSYANSSFFKPLYQRFTVPPADMALRINRRDGYLLDGGYEHGNIVFSIPLECHAAKFIKTDTTFILALVAAGNQQSPTMRRLRSALSFFNLAFTDSPIMSTEAEIILLGSAFEQLYGSDNCYRLTCDFGETFRQHGQVIAEKAKQTRKGITFKSEYETQQKGWFVHKKWIEELHNLRSRYIHGEDVSKRQWGWSPEEHLLMASYLFPLSVKICLSNEEHYQLTEMDKRKCRAMDHLLAATDWSNFERSRDRRSKWRKIIESANDGAALRAAIEKADEKINSEL